jgi:hypothetical protein
MGLFRIKLREWVISRIFRCYGVGLKNFIGLIVAFGLAIAFIYGVIYIKLWAFLILTVALIIALVFAVRRKSNLGPISSTFRKSDEPEFQTGHCKNCGKEVGLEELEQNGLCTRCRWEVEVGIKSPSLDSAAEQREGANKIGKTT